MNNNLTIANLMKTDWINQFENLQLNEIKEGLKDNLNVSYYAKSEYDWMKMRELRTTLKYGSDIFK